MKRWSGCLAPLIIGASLFCGYVAPQDRQYVDYFLRLHAAELFRQRAFVLQGCQAYVSQRQLERVDMRFLCYKAISVDQARRLLVTLVQDLVNRINSDSVLKEKQLVIQPFRSDQVHFELRTDNIFSREADVATVQRIILEGNTITYRTYKAATLFSGPSETFQETYQYALMLLDEPTEYNPEATRPKGRIKNPELLPMEGIHPQEVLRGAMTPQSPETVKPQKPVRQVETPELPTMEKTAVATPIEIEHVNSLRNEPEVTPEPTQDELVGMLRNEVLTLFPKFSEPPKQHPTILQTASFPTTRTQKTSIISESAFPPPATPQSTPADQPFIMKEGYSPEQNQASIEDSSSQMVATLTPSASQEPLTPKTQPSSVLKEASPEEHALTNEVPMEPVPAKPVPPEHVLTDSLQEKSSPEILTPAVQPTPHTQEAPSSVEKIFFEIFSPSSQEKTQTIQDEEPKKEPKTIDEDLVESTSEKPSSPKSASESAQENDLPAAAVQLSPVPPSQAPTPAQPMLQSEKYEQPAPSWLKRVLTSVSRQDDQTTLQPSSMPQAPQQQENTEEPSTTASLEPLTPQPITPPAASLETKEPSSQVQQAQETEKATKTSIVDELPNAPEVCTSEVSQSTKTSWIQRFLQRFSSLRKEASNITEISTSTTGTTDTAQTADEAKQESSSLNLLPQDTNADAPSSQVDLVTYPAAAQELSQTSQDHPVVNLPTPTEPTTVQSASSTSIETATKAQDVAVEEMKQPVVTQKEQETQPSWLKRLFTKITFSAATATQSTTAPEQTSAIPVEEEGSKEQPRPILDEVIPPEILASSSSQKEESVFANEEVSAPPKDLSEQTITEKNSLSQNEQTLESSPSTDTNAPRPSWLKRLIVQLTPSQTSAPQTSLASSEQPSATLLDEEDKEQHDLTTKEETPSTLSVPAQKEPVAPSKERVVLEQSPGETQTDSQEEQHQELSPSSSQTSAPKVSWLKKLVAKLIPSKELESSPAPQVTSKPDETSPQNLATEKREEPQATQASTPSEDVKLIQRSWFMRLLARAVPSADATTKIVSDASSSTPKQETIASPENEESNASDLIQENALPTPTLPVSLAPENIILAQEPSSELLDEPESQKTVEPQEKALLLPQKTLPQDRTQGPSWLKRLITNLTTSTSNTQTPKTFYGEEEEEEEEAEEETIPPELIATAHDVSSNEQNVDTTPKASPLSSPTLPEQEADAITLPPTNTVVDSPKPSWLKRLITTFTQTSLPPDEKTASPLEEQVEDVMVVTQKEEKAIEKEDALAPSEEQIPPSTVTNQGQTKSGPSWLKRLITKMTGSTSVVTTTAPQESAAAPTETSSSVTKDLRQEKQSDASQDDFKAHSEPLSPTQKGPSWLKRVLTSLQQQPETPKEPEHKEPELPLPQQKPSSFKKLIARLNGRPIEEQPQPTASTHKEDVISPSQTATEEPSWFQRMVKRWKQPKQDEQPSEDVSSSQPTTPSQPAQVQPQESPSWLQRLRSTFSKKEPSTEPNQKDPAPLPEETPAVQPPVQQASWLKRFITSFSKTQKDVEEQTPKVSQPAPQPEAADRNDDKRPQVVERKVKPYSPSWLKRVITTLRDTVNAPSTSGDTTNASVTNANVDNTKKSVDHSDAIEKADTIDEQHLLTPVETPTPLKTTIPSETEEPIKEKTVEFQASQPIQPQESEKPASPEQQQTLKTAIRDTLTWLRERSKVPTSADVDTPTSVIAFDDEDDDEASASAEDSHPYQWVVELGNAAPQDSAPEAREEPTEQLSWYKRLRHWLFRSKESSSPRREEENSHQKPLWGQEKSSEDALETDAAAED